MTADIITSLPEQAEDLPTEEGEPSLSEKCRQLAIRVEQCHCQIAILVKALQPCGTYEEFAEVASMAQNVLEPVVEALAGASADMTLLWSSVERLEEESDRRP